MEVKNSKMAEMIEASLNQTEKSIEMLRDGDLCRRFTALELRDLQLSCHEDFVYLRRMFDELDEQIQAEIQANTKWIQKKIGIAKATADQALSSTLMVKDIQMLEKKVNILKESVIQLNKAYYKYAKDVNMPDLMQQVKEMVARTQKMEKDVLMSGVTMDEQTMENIFRSAIESLYGLQSSNPKVLEEAKSLANDLCLFRNAAGNKNFFKMVSKSNSTGSSENSACSSSESSFQSSESKTSSDSVSLASASSIQTSDSSVLLPKN